jgi:hypothetical protein
VRETATTPSVKNGFGLRKCVLVAVAATAFLLVASPASAQIPPTSQGQDFCSVTSYTAPLGAGGVPGSFTAPNGGVQSTALNISGPGSVAVSMYGTNAQECLKSPTGTPPTCSTSCTIQTQAVCEYHCQHNHIAPYAWTIALSPAAPGFSRWDGPCVPTVSAPRSWCIVQTSYGPQAPITATFGGADSTFPSAPSLSASPGSYQVDLSWSASADPDQNLAGYDIFRNGVLVTRVSAATNSFRVTTNIACHSAYSFRVEAFDWTGNGNTSNTFSTMTLACVTGGGARPNTIIHVKPPRVTKSRRAFFHYGWRGDVPANKFQCKLDRRRWVRCSGLRGKLYRNLRLGYHRFYVRAGNSVGFDRTPARYRWRIRRA